MNLLNLTAFLPHSSEVAYTIRQLNYYGPSDCQAPLVVTVIGLVCKNVILGHVRPQKKGVCPYPQFVRP